MPSPDQIDAGAERAGVDLEMLDFNLTLTPEERARRHDAVLALVLELKRAGKTLRVEVPPDYSILSLRTKDEE